MSAWRQWGVTTVGHGRTYWQRGMLDAWLDAEADGVLMARVSVRPWTYPEVDRDTRIDMTVSGGTMVYER